MTILEIIVGGFLVYMMFGLVRAVWDHSSTVSDEDIDRISKGGPGH